MHRRGFDCRYETEIVRVDEPDLLLPGVGGNQNVGGRGRLDDEVLVAGAE
ncbi:MULTISPECIES: hypothetical protein [unclassified Streptomyces]|nr:MULTISPECIES: hypothetical protein [unclassified Streptomyces]MCX4403385.1 hypothetical protein [Streptomyces sp. NBC_01764]MCX5181640.1 hypothetical protein [Streptomyces sp. NBC_00268]